MPQRPDSEVSGPEALSFLKKISKLQNIPFHMSTCDYWHHSKRWLRIAYSMYFLESMIAIATSEVAFFGTNMLEF